MSHTSPIRVAVLSDIHGNLIAFEAALAQLRNLSPDVIILGGDIVNGSPDSRACWDIAVNLGVPIIRGNHERYLTLMDNDVQPLEWDSERFAPIRWSAAQFTHTERDTMRDLPLVYRHPELPDILFCHGSPRSDNDSIFSHTPESRLAEMLGDMPERILIRAHQHVTQTRLWNGKTIVTAGSVGLPLDHFPTAQFLLMERRGERWETLHQSVEYDVAAAAQRFYSTGYLDAVGPVARLSLREVVTASYHWVPFLRAYTRWSPDHTMPLGPAIERFLNEDV